MSSESVGVGKVRNAASRNSQRLLNQECVKIPTYESYRVGVVDDVERCRFSSINRCD